MRPTLPLPLLVFALSLPACSRDEPAPASDAPAAVTQPAKAPAAPAGESVAAPPKPAPAAVKPEDQVLDAEREAPVRAKAQELDAIRPEEVGRLPMDSNVVVLVRGVPRGAGAGPIYGSGPYTLDSNIRVAAVHHGALQEGELGLVRVTVIKHDDKHFSVPQNGVTPHKWGEYHTSYTLEKVTLDQPR